MQVYKAPVESYIEWLKALGYSEQEYDLSTVRALLQAAAEFAEQDLLPANAKGDAVGCDFDQQHSTVKLPDDFKDLYQRYRQQGFASAGGLQQYGGAAMPLPIVLAFVEFMSAGNMAFSLGPMLTPGACQAIEFAGTQKQKEFYLPKMTSGAWSGTMCLTESHCGTDLGLIRTKATPSGDHYIINGDKIWITYGEHDLTENIVHLVLAKLPDAPKGSQGISMFIVPKILADGTRNSVYCTGLESKLGQHAAPTCFMNFDNAQGYLLGAVNSGLKNMFVMMNEARLGVGVSGLALSEIAYQTALAFAQDRRQSRSLNPERNDAEHAADCILVHPDVRHQLLGVKATNLAMRGLVVYVGVLSQSSLPEDQARLHLLIPVVKSFLSEQGVTNINACMQLIGGSGYVRDWHIEQYWRDARISMIYEGTNGIQALDLIGRKLAGDNGQAMRALMSAMLADIDATTDVNIAKIARDSYQDLQQATIWLMQHASKDPEQGAAVASEYLRLVGLNVLAMMWLKMLQHDQADVRIATYYFEHILPATKVHLSRIERGKDTLFLIRDDQL